MKTSRRFLYICTVNYNDVIMNEEVKKPGIVIPFGAKDSELTGFEYKIPDGYEGIIENGVFKLRKLESEGEKIRKALIKEFEKKLEKGFEWVEYGIPNNAVLKWLRDKEEKETDDWISDKDKKFYDDALSALKYAYEDLMDKNSKDSAKDVHDAYDWLKNRFTHLVTKDRHNRMAPIYENVESFENALEAAWEFYNKSASRTVDSFEDDYIECAFSKGFREGFLFGRVFSKNNN